MNKSNRRIGYYDPEKVLRIKRRHSCIGNQYQRKYYDERY